MAAIDLYVDPVCPFGWVTAQWLLDAARDTGRQVALRQMSLAVLNEGTAVDAGHQPMIDRSRRLGRLLRPSATSMGRTDSRGCITQSAPAPTSGEKRSPPKQSPTPSLPSERTDH